MQRKLFLELKIKNIKIFCKSIADIVSFTYLQLVLYLCNLLPGRPGNIIIEPVRIFFLKLISIKIGKKSQVSKGFLYLEPEILKLELDVDLGMNSEFGIFIKLQLKIIC